mgnify:CR=1 FL=1
MDDNYCLLPERISEQFSEIDSDIVMDLSDANPEYAALKRADEGTASPISFYRKPAGK